MFTEPLTVHKTLEFILRHLAFHSVTGLAQIVGVEGSGVRAGLTGKRPIPLVQVGKLAAAAGLKLQIDDAGGQRLVIADGVTINLSINLNELRTLVQVARALGDKPPTWKYVQATDGKGAYATALVRIEVGRHGTLWYGYLAAHVRDRLLAPGLACVDEQLADEQVIHKPSLPVGDSDWIRLRAGLHGASELDAIYKQQVARVPPPTALDWAEVFKLASQYKMHPHDILQAMQDRHKALHS